MNRRSRIPDSGLTGLVAFVAAACSEWRASAATSRSRGSLGQRSAGRPKWQISIAGALSGSCCYTKSKVWYVQPLTQTLTNECRGFDSTWSNSTHLVRSMQRSLIQGILTRTQKSSDTLPPVQDVLALVRVPEPARCPPFAAPQITFGFSGYKMTCTQVGPTAPGRNGPASDKRSCCRRSGALRSTVRRNAAKRDRHEGRADAHADSNHSPLSFQDLSQLGSRRDVSNFHLRRTRNRAISSGSETSGEAPLRRGLSKDNPWSDPDYLAGNISPYAVPWEPSPWLGRGTGQGSLLPAGPQHSTGIPHATRNRDSA